ncbi:MAG TPA: hypothetical protein VMV23_00345 [Candidatus Nanopelagicaceae bacterium]|nr:hypothetical protein [Candidatus Nanopelagicaceae bacterium]
MDCRSTGDDALYLVELVDTLRDQVLSARLSVGNAQEVLFQELAGGEPPLKAAGTRRI